MTSAPGDSVAWLEDSNGKRIPIHGSCLLGRTAANHVPLPDERVSRRHAMIHAQQALPGEEQHEYLLVDFSRNGTYLNGKRITQPTRLRDGNLIRVGPFQLIFHRLASDQDVTSTTTMADQTVTDLRAGRCWLLIADIIGSSRMRERMADDEVARLTSQWLAECKSTIEGGGGRINQFLGDGFFAFWHDHERAEADVHRALEGLRRMQDHGQPAFRVVVHLAQVMIGGLSIGEEERIGGSDVIFVFRQEKLAKRLGKIRLLSEPAWNRLAALVSAEEAGRHPLEGLDGDYTFYAF